MANKNIETKYEMIINKLNKIDKDKKSSRLGAPIHSTHILGKIAPLRECSQYCISAIPDCGKTVTLQNFLKTVDPSYKIYLLQVGERDTELDDWMDLFPNINAFAISAKNSVVREDELEVALDTLDDCITEIGNETEKCIFVIDSLTRIADWLTSELTKAKDTKSGGLRADSFDLAKKLLYLAGTYDAGKTITVIGTVLSSEDGDKGKKIIVESICSTVHTMVPFTKTKNWNGKKISFDWKCDGYSYRGRDVSALREFHDKVQMAYQSNTNDEINQFISKDGFKI